jgi:subtilisin-like proprotein convertase family protein
MIGRKIGGRCGGRLAALVAVLALGAAAIPAGAAAEVETHTFVNAANLHPTGDANDTFGIANLYPETIEVPFYAGTITKVTTTIVDLDSGRPEDIDLALVSPDGTAVMLMSDACGNDSQNLAGDDWTFDDDASIFLSRIACRTDEVASFKPTNYFEEEHPDQLEVNGGGPPGPYLNELAEFDGKAPGGLWQLYVLDDSMGVVGFEVGGWSLSIGVAPPPTTTPVTTPPATGTTTPPATGGGGTAVTAPLGPSPVAKPKRTGRRAAAVARCKKKTSGKARRRCRAHARTLPV